MAYKPATMGDTTDTDYCSRCCATSLANAPNQAAREIHEPKSTIVATHSKGAIYVKLPDEATAACRQAPDGSKMTAENGNAQKTLAARVSAGATERAQERLRHEREASGLGEQAPTGLKMIAIEIARTSNSHATALQ